MSERNRFEVIINAIKTGTPIATPRSRFEEVINAIVGAGGGSNVSVTPIQTTGTKIAEITIDDAGYDIYAPASGGFQVITEASDHLNYNSPVTVAAGAFNSDNTVVFNILNNLLSYSVYIHARAVLAGAFEIGIGGQSNVWYQIRFENNTFTVTNCSVSAPDITEIGVI